MRSRLMSHIVLVLFIAVSLVHKSFAQNSAATATAILKADYYQKTANQLKQYNGIKYLEYNAYYNDKAYFNSSKFQNTTLFYDGSVFDNTPALYDMYRELVVIRYIDTADKISLSNSKLDSFVMSGHKFIRIDADANIKPGFYEQLYNGKAQLLKKYTVSTIEDKSEGVTKHQFYQETQLYVRINGVYNSISGGRALLSQLKNRRKELNDYLSSNKLSKSLTEDEMVKLLLYYDNLNR